jgi:hypothetical protein
VTDDPQRFADAAIEVYTNSVSWSKVQSQGQHIVASRFDAAHWQPELPKILEEAVAQLTTDRHTQFVGRMLRHHQHRSTEFMSRWIEAKNRSL